jgi:hypothetical protein
MEQSFSHSLEKLRRPRPAISGALLLSIALLAIGGCASSQVSEDQVAADQLAADQASGQVLENSGNDQGDSGMDFSDTLGIRIESLRLTASDYMLDMRYRVIDPEKAALILNRKEHPRIEVQRSGAILGVPVSYKLGPIRQTTLDPNPDRIYFTFFANPGHHVQRGDTVTLLLGDYRAENIVVQ